MLIKYHLKPLISRYYWIKLVPEIRIHILTELIKLQTYNHI